MVQQVRMLSRVPHDFLRDAADIDAGATERSVLDHGSVDPVLGRPLRMGETTTAAAQHNQLESNRHVSPVVPP
jgi:hypothetical protein